LRLGAFLWLFTFLLFLRVIGQVIVVLRHPRWLPPMEQWMSGLVPYRLLLPAQIVILTLMVWIASDISRESGFFAEPAPHWGRAAIWFSYLYAGAMVVRYVVRMARRPDERWTGGTIPIIFHCVVAAFLWSFGHYHTRVLE
jgi:hypothetical protein